MSEDSAVTPFRSQISAPLGNHQQPDTEAKPLLGEPGAKPVYLKLKPDAVTPPVNPSSTYIESGTAASDPTQLSGQVVCPVDGSVMTIVGSMHGAWRCVAEGHQFDLANQAPQAYAAVYGTLPAGPASGDQSGIQNL
jgi:hypothetical protein